ncbi:MAG: DNA-protecting protein DprA [Cytophagaceae bacterium]|nr:DNA-protecting protein DprA [Gemmatimonadaceae bacterium]
MDVSPTLALRCARGIGAAGYHRAVAEAGGADSALQALPGAVRDEAWDRARSVDTVARRVGIAVLEIGSAGYPQALHALEDPPPVLFAIGRHELLDRPAVAVVGTRDATAYGVRVTTRLASGASRSAVTVVSGLARGVDAHAHRSALEGAGGTIAVLGTGVDVPYPLENRALHESVCRRGLVVAEALPGARAHRGSFPQRNRIIAALADVVLVTEAGVKSGALITATIAAAINRLHAAVPGPIDIPTSAGSNQLLRDGAQVVTSVEDLLGLVALTPRGRGARPAATLTSATPANDALSTDERRILEILAAGPRLPDELLAASSLAPAALAAALATLSVLGHAEVDAGGMVRRA